MCNPLETSIIIIISCLRCLSLLTAWPPEYRGYRITEWIYLLRLSGCCPIPALSVANPTTTRRSNWDKISTRVQSSLIFLSGVYCRFIYTSYSSSVWIRSCYPWKRRTQTLWGTVCGACPLCPAAGGRERGGCCSWSTPLCHTLHLRVIMHVCRHGFRHP